MAKIYKLSFYITDYNEEYEDREHLKYNLIDHIDHLGVGTDHLEIQESEEFEWDDDLIINKIDSGKEDFEVYFKTKNK